MNQIQNCLDPNLLTGIDHPLFAFRYLDRKKKNKIFLPHKMVSSRSIKLKLLSFFNYPSIGRFVLFRNWKWYNYVSLKHLIQIYFDRSIFITELLAQKKKENFSFIEDWFHPTKIDYPTCNLLYFVYPIFQTTSLISLSLSYFFPIRP